jgi:hypothetical protein
VAEDGARRRSTRSVAAAGLNSSDSHKRDQSRLLVNELGAHGLSNLRERLR